MNIPVHIYILIVGERLNTVSEEDMIQADRQVDLQKYR